MAIRRTAVLVVAAAAMMFLPALPAASAVPSAAAGVAAVTEFGNSTVIETDYQLSGVWVAGEGAEARVYAGTVTGSEIGGEPFRIVGSSASALHGRCAPTIPFVTVTDVFSLGSFACTVSVGGSALAHMTVNIYGVPTSQSGDVNGPGNATFRSAGVFFTTP